MPWIVGTAAWHKTPVAYRIRERFIRLNVAPAIDGAYVQRPAILRTRRIVRSERQALIARTWIGRRADDASASDREPVPDNRALALVVAGGGRSVLSCSKLTVGTATVVLLVALRLSIGWHFFKEGEKKLIEPNFSSAPFLRQAHGPLAPLFHSFLPDVHGWRQELGQPLFDSPGNRYGGQVNSGGQADTDARPPYAAWSDRILRERQTAVDRFIARQRLDNKARRKADAVFAARRQQLLDYLDSQREEITKYRYELGRLDQMERRPESTGVPFEKSRTAEKSQQTKTQPLVWVRQVQAFDVAFANDLRGLLGDRPDASNAPVFPAGKLAKLNWAVTYVTLGVGVCLMLGLCTRTASVVGAVFLMSVIATQPPGWVGVQPMYKEFVEMIAMLTLATTPVGRWGGLDFFIHTAFSACCGSKETTE